MSLVGGIAQTIRVLLVDDHPVVRDGYRRLLENTRDIRAVAEAGDGETAILRYFEHAPDVVILDLGMPGMGGMECIRRLMAKDPAAHILVFSMHDSETMILRALEAGVLGYLTKSNGMGQMVDAVRLVAQGKPFVGSEHIPEILRRRATPGSDPLRALSAREFQLFRAFAEGQSVSGIADALSISPKTVGVHHANIMKKLGLQNSTQLVRLALRCGVIDP